MLRLQRDLHAPLRVFPVEESRHARGVEWIGRRRGIRVVFLLFAPKGRAKASGSGSPQAANHPHHTKIRTVDRPLAGTDGEPARSSGRSDGIASAGKIVKLPRGDGCEAGWWVRPIFENSTACTCQMPIFFSVDHFFGGWWGSFLDQFMDVSLIFVFGHG